MFTITMNSAAIEAMTSQIQQRMLNMTPLMQSIAAELVDEAELNFAAQGRPKWAGLKPVTIARRGSSNPILQVSGGLAGSITPFHGADFAGVGSNKKYAATQQFGAKKRQFKGVAPWGDIEPRPFIPIDKMGNLQPEAEDAVIGVVTHYLRSLGFN
jgi:phage virion morphogenesis protein